jgi:hypothetical protein
VLRLSATRRNGDRVIISIEQPIYRSPPSSFTANRLGVPKERMITVMIESDNWLTKARQGSRRPVIRAGLSDEDIDRMIEQAQKEVEPPLG